MPLSPQPSFRYLSDASICSCIDLRCAMFRARACGQYQNISEGVRVNVLGLGHAYSHPITFIHKHTHSGICAHKKTRLHAHTQIQARTTNTAVRTSQTNRKASVLICNARHFKFLGTYLCLPSIVLHLDLFAEDSIIIIYFVASTMLEYIGTVLQWLLRISSVYLFNLVPN